MNRKDMPEISYLLSEVESRYGRRIETSTDFESLSIVIEHTIGEMISASTLKRLWGYVSLNPTPRIATLNVLARFAGHQDFKSFCESLKDSKAFVSTFFTSEYLASSDLEAGNDVIIGWAPDRMVTLMYLGENMFELKESVKSKLKQGDRFELSEIIKKYPLVISRILRDGEYTPSYIAGQQGGINYVKVVPTAGQQH